MKKLLPILALIFAALFVGRTLLPSKNPGAYDLVAFGQLPVLTNGRIQPLDTLARRLLLQFQNRQEVRAVGVRDPLVSSPTEWLLDAAFRSEKADAYTTFLIDNPEILLLIGRSGESLRINYDSVVLRILASADFVPKTHRRFSFNEIQPHLDKISEQARLADAVESAVRTPFQRGVMQLYSNVLQYQQLKHSFVSPGRADFVGDLLRLQDKLGPGIDAIRAKQAGQPHDEAGANALMDMGERFSVMEKASVFRPIPPDASESDPTAWQGTGAALLQTFRTGRVNSSALAYAGLAHAWRQQQPEQFNKIVELYRSGLEKRFTPQLEKSAAEARFNAVAPFYTSLTLYVLAFFAAVVSWLIWPQALGRSAVILIAVAWLVATAGILTRMWLEGRPPVTNLYSSALFIGWGSVALCLVLEYYFRNAVGSVAAGVIGFSTLLIAHHLSLSGDTLEMMRAVLDSNFWLATHVIIVTAGYSATFLAGFLALIYIFRGLFTKTLDKATADSLNRMVYGIVCFATFFSFTGTVLGGIWADQSWGRFWGWDPKENGALMIVIWNALILHCRWGGFIKARGLMILAVGGNIITSWSWFGTNMLGVGLHSYGFTDAAFWALTLFVLSQLAIIGLANVPLSKWRSFRGPAA